MNCERFESLLADALGDELSAPNRPAFEEHLRTCEHCRGEYDSSSSALSAMRSLPAPSIVSVDVGGSDGVPFSRVAWTTKKRVTLRWSAALRYAATIVIAFAAGYFYRADQKSSATTPGVEPTMFSHPSNERVVPDLFGSRERFAQSPPRSFEAALAGAHLQNPSRSDLAKCMIAMFATPR
jgi:hypothetical protein